MDGEKKPRKKRRRGGGKQGRPAIRNKLVEFWSFNPNDLDSERIETGWLGPTGSFYRTVYADGEAKSVSAKTVAATFAHNRDELLTKKIVFVRILAKQAREQAQAAHENAYLLKRKMYALEQQRERLRRNDKKD